MREAALKRPKPHNQGMSVEVTDLLRNETIKYSSITATALALGVKHHSNISCRRLRRTKTPYLGRYIIKFDS